MARPRLIIVCGVPGSGKSTFAARAVDRWQAVAFASEAFAEELGAVARTASGDLSKQAIAHAYAAMGIAVTNALAKSKLTVAVGSFRTEELRKRFRDIAESSEASATTLRIVCSAETAADRVRARLANGERGPTLETISRIDAELDRANDVEIMLINNLSLEHFYRKADAVMQALDWACENDASNADIARRLDHLGIAGFAAAGDVAAVKSHGGG
jgi:predicted kinase